MKDVQEVVKKKGILRRKVKEGETYYYCTCGLSKNDPFCDNSHSNTGFKPIKYTAEEDKAINFCGCRLSKKGYLCDGAHGRVKKTIPSNISS